MTEQLARKEAPRRTTAGLSTRLESFTSWLCSASPRPPATLNGVRPETRPRPRSRRPVGPNSNF
ncbi:hypothetical protein Ae717Ps2_5833c [Pseudonocardia sp. Ae717_Ps2]|nr:hypothetical protein Ae717Ps2_5833c [Pseudonocardia sp. Ae717_Ps2]